MRLNKIDRAHYIMRWIHQRGKGQSRNTDVIADKTGIPLSSVKATIQRDWPDCFVREPGVGYNLTGEFPEGVPINLDFPRIREAGTVEGFDEPLSRNGHWEWNEEVMSALNQQFHTCFGAGMLTTARNVSEDEAKMLLRMAKSQAEFFKRLIASGTIGTSRQIEWSHV
jgi:hypothetical protein